MTKQKRMSTFVMNTSQGIVTDTKDFSSVFVALSAIEVWSCCGAGNPADNGALTHTTMCGDF